MQSRYTGLAAVVNIHIHIMLHSEAKIVEIFDYPPAFGAIENSELDN